MKRTPKLTLVQKILNATKRNKNKFVRSMVYGDLAKANISGGNFLTKALKSTMSKNVKNMAKKERHSFAREQLLKLAKKLKE